MRNKFKIRAKVWIYPGVSAAWHFVSVPKKESREIRDTFEAMKRGWGSLPVLVTIGNTSWKTSIFPESKTEEYLLPIRAQVRKKEGIKRGDAVTLTLEIQV